MQALQCSISHPKYHKIPVIQIVTWLQGILSCTKTFYRSHLTLKLVIYVSKFTQHNLITHLLLHLLQIWTKFFCEEEKKIAQTSLAAFNCGVLGRLNGQFLTLTQQKKMLWPGALSNTVVQLIYQNSKELPSLKFTPEMSSTHYYPPIST